MRLNTAIHLIAWIWGGLYALPGTAQNKHHQLLLGAGMASSRHFEVAGVWKEALDGAGSTTANSSGVYHLGYRYEGAGRQSFGILLTGERQEVTKTGAALPELTDKYKAWNDSYLAVLLDYRYNWGLRPRSKWYSGVAPGISWQRRKETHNDFSLEKEEFERARFAYQVTAVGFSFGRKIGGYAELGYGYKGILSAGLKYGF